MACKGDIEREKKLARLFIKYDAKRQELKKVVKNTLLDPEERVKAMLELNQLPRNSSKTRATRRCSITGSPRAHLRFFGLGRHAFRNLARSGSIPGVKKASW